MLSSLILSRHNLTLSRHSSIDVVCFISRHGCLLLRQKFPPPALQLCCNSLCYVVTLFSLLRQSFSQLHGFVVVTYFFFVATELCCLVLLRLNSVSQQTLFMSQQSLLYSLSLAELFYATLNPLSRQTCLSSSHLSSIFRRDIKLLYRDRNL